jgi:hypothetical protein
MKRRISKRSMRATQGEIDLDEMMVSDEIIVTDDESSTDDDMSASGTMVRDQCEGGR